MKKIHNLEMFLSAELYLPMMRETEGSWFDLYQKITNLEFDPDKSFIMVEQAAKYITENPRYTNRDVEIIRKRIKDLEFKRFTVEACPSRLANSNRIFLRGGNKRSIAYAIRVMNGEIYQPIVVCNWSNEFTRLDSKDFGIHCICW